MKLVTQCYICNESVLILRQVASVWHYAAVDLAPSPQGTVTVDESNGTYAGVGRVRSHDRRAGVLHTMHAQTCKGRKRAEQEVQLDRKEE